MGKKIQVVKQDGLVSIVWTPSTGEDPVTYRGQPDWLFLGSCFSAADDVLGPPGDERLKKIITNRVNVMASWIREWDGLEVAGSPAPCDEATKLAHLLGTPDAAAYLYGALTERAEKNRVRGEEFGSGLPSGSPTATLIAEKASEAESLTAVVL